MIKKLAGYGTALIALYLIVQHGSATGTIITKGAAGAVSGVKALQGR